ncbi:hypothetical protein MUB46_24050, partial [Microbaculum sp. A6E488]|nr:hypothetical protein [Microbaculum sp. A6E488]MCT8974940.1 hypothetical protein [Microbaculum sp. A6E488]
MQADTAATPDIYADDAPGKSGNGKARLLSIEDLDGRTRASRHCQQIRDEILNDLGGADQLSTLERRAAEHV